MPETDPAVAPTAATAKRAGSLSQLAELPPREFAVAAHRVMLGRAPTGVEVSETVSALLRGEPRTWLLGRLRYGDEGRARAVDIPGLRLRYLAQRMCRLPGIGRLAVWIMALVRLPVSLRYFRAMHQAELDRNARMVAELSEVRATLAEHAHASADLAQALEAMNARLTGLEAAVDADRASIASVAERIVPMGAAIDSLRNVIDGNARDAAVLGVGVATLRERLGIVTAQVDASRDAFVTFQERARAAEAAIEILAVRAGSTDAANRDLTERVSDVRRALESVSERGLRAESTLGAILPPELGRTYEIAGSALVEPAIARRNPGPPVVAASLSPDERYVLFEDVFYDSFIVLEKQRVYIGEIDRALSSRLPFLDLGCGRGEFLRILREAGIDALGVDINRASLRIAREHGLRVVEGELASFLAGDRAMYCGASLLQVAEHLTAAQIEQVLALVAARLAPGALLIVETPNPLSPFALGQFHTDPTHVDPIPPERLRFAIEVAGFRDSRTLFQGRVPAGQFAGPEPRAYYMDYAVIARRSL